MSRASQGQHEVVNAVVRILGYYPCKIWGTICEIGQRSHPLHILGTSRFHFRVPLGAEVLADDDTLFSVSRQNELFDPIRRGGAHILPVDTFERGFGAISNLFRLRKIRRELLAAIAKYRIDRVVVLMSHVWTPLLADSIRCTGARYIVMVHDASNHPGDATALVNRWLLRDALKADEVVTLSEFVRSALIARFPQLEARGRRPSSTR